VIDTNFLCITRVIKLLSTALVCTSRHISLSYYLTELLSERWYEIRGGLKGVMLQVIKQQSALTSAAATGVERAGNSSNAPLDAVSGVVVLVYTYCTVLQCTIYYPEGTMSTIMIFQVQMLPKLRIPPPRGPLALVFSQPRAVSASPGW